MSPKRNRVFVSAALLLTAFWGCVCTGADSTKANSSEAGTRLWRHDNLAGWLVDPPSDSKARSPEACAEMLTRLGIRNFVYRAPIQDVATYDTEIDTLNRHGIKLLAWRLDYEADDPITKNILETIARHHLHPQLWVTGSSSQIHWPKVDKSEKDLPPAAQATDGHEIFMSVLRDDLTSIPQPLRVEQEARRILALRTLAAGYGVKVELYNHNGWFGNPDNQVAIIERLKQLGVGDVGMVYNFSHARDELHDDTLDFPAVWNKIKPYVVAVNLAGMRMDHQFVLLSQGDSELEMMRTIQASGWVGPVGLIAEQGGDAEISLRNNLTGLDWLAAELREPGSGGGHPFPDLIDEKWKTTVRGAVVARASDNQVIDYPWGRLTWYVSRALKNSDTMTVGQAVVRVGQSNGLHFHPNCDEILHVLKGRIIQAVGNQSIEMREGDTVSIPVGIKHGTKNIGTEDAVLAISYSSADRRVIGE